MSKVRKDVNMNSPVRIEGLEYSYGDKAVLNSIDLSIKEGMFNCILGPNGSGKTTLIKNIIRQINPSKNTIMISGKDVMDYKIKDLSKVVSTVSQSTNIEFDFTAYDIAMMGRNPHIKRFQRETSADHDIVVDAMKKTDSWKFKDRSVRNLSGGERQRVILARAIAQNPDILVLDEPITYLDISHQLSIMKLIKELSVERKITVIAILHDLNLAMEFGDYFMFLKDGRIEIEGLQKEIISAENIRKIYDIDVVVMKNPVTGSPFIIPC